MPYALAKNGEITGQFTAPLTKEQFKAAPSYDREQLAGQGYGWSEQATHYFEGLDAAA